MPQNSIIKTAVINIKNSTTNTEYPIYIGTNLINDSKYLQNYIHPQQKVLIISNTKIMPLYGDIISASIKKLTSFFYNIVLEDGEQYKNLNSINNIYNTLLENNFDRRSVIVALGGGVVGDMAGFAAATFMRGINFIQIPTTLLAQVDSSIGGKTGVNHSLGKNMVGAFYQPKAVISDINTLKTLEKRELISGIAEIIKHAFIFDVDFIQWLENNIQSMLNLNLDIINQAIIKSCNIKKYFVTQDEKEQNIRAYLNFGHTFAHAIETATNYKTWLHGEAVGCGMAIASELSFQMGLINQQENQRILNLIQSCGLPIELPKINSQEYIKHMLKDKKNHDHNIQFILLKNLGEAIISQAPQELIHKVLCKFGAT